MAHSVSLIHDVLMGKDQVRITDYKSTDAYARHNPAITDGPIRIVVAVEILTAQNRMFKHTGVRAVLGKGTFVLTVCESEWSGQPHAYYDLFRMNGGKIVEHWDVIQPVPTEGLANANGMFGGLDAD